MAILKPILLVLSFATIVNGFSALKRPFSLPEVASESATVSKHVSTLSDGTFTVPKATSMPNKRVSKYSSSSLHMSSTDLDNDDSPWYSQVSVPYAVALVVFIGFAALLAPGEFGSKLDNNMIQAYIDNPASPGLNPIFNAEFNLLGAAAIVLAGLVLPQSVSKGLPPGPFIAAASFAGYGGLGPYMMFRKGPRENATQSDIGWISKNVFENKLVNVGILALCVLQYYIMLGPLLDDPSGVWQDFCQLVQTSKFASVSTVDLMILSWTGASLIPLDYKYRQPDADDAQVKLIAASTMLLPMLGSAIYCALRPPLPEE